MKCPPQFKSNLLVLFSVAFFASCTSEDPITPVEPELTPFNQEAISYFKEVALGFEFGNASQITLKWGSGNMKVFVGGTPTAALNEELRKVVSEINALSTDGFQIEVLADSVRSNFYVFIGSGNAYATIFPSQRANVANNWGLFSVFWGGNDNLARGYMYVDIFRANPTEQRHLLREELTQSLGLARDSPKYPDSIFQQSWTNTTTFAPIDKELIRLLYHPKIISGFTASEVEILLTEILLKAQQKMQF